MKPAKTPTLTIPATNTYYIIDLQTIKKYFCNILHFHCWQHKISRTTAHHPIAKNALYSSLKSFIFYSEETFVWYYFMQFANNTNL